MVEDFGKRGTEVAHTPQGDAQSMQFLQGSRVPEFRQVKGLAEVLSRECDGYRAPASLLARSGPTAALDPKQMAILA